MGPRGKRYRLKGWRGFVSAALAVGIPATLIIVMFLLRPETSQALSPEAERKIIDGVECVLYHRSSQGTAISCNWEKYNRQGI